MKVVFVAEAPDGSLYEESDPTVPDEIRDAIEQLKKMPDDVIRDAAMISSLLNDFPDAGNHFLFGVYRDSGGQSPWKDFRRAVSLLRGVRTGSKEEEEHRLRMLRKEEMEERAVLRKRAEEERAKRAKEKATMTTIRREDLRRGQHVYVRVRYGDQMKLRPAKINEVMRAAVNLSIEGEPMPRTVRFNEIELSLDSTDKAPSTAPSLAAVPPAFAALGEGRGVTPAYHERRQHPHVEVRRPHHPAPLPEAPPPPLAPPPPAPPPADDLGQVNAWVEQGAAMRDSLVKRQDALRAAMDDLAAEALRVEEALTAKKAEMARITAMLAALDQMRAVAAA